MSKQFISLLFIGFLFSAPILFSAGEPSVEVKGFSDQEKSSLPGNIRDRVWTEVRSSLYDGKGGTRLFIIVPPSGVAGTDIIKNSFADYTHWLKIAERDGAVMVFPAPVDDLKWDGTDLEYLEAVYAHCNKYVIEGASRYIAAYGDAGIPVSLLTVKNTELFAGAAFTDAEFADINSDALKRNLPLALQLINSNGKNAVSFVNYFKSANGANKVRKINSGNTIHYRDGFSSWNEDYSKSHFVQVVGKINEEVPNYIYQNLFRAVARWKTVESEGTLRGRRRADNTEGFYKIEEKGSPVRTAYVYIPSSLRNSSKGKAAPVVMLFHGVTCNGEYFMDQSGWMPAAEKNKFIVYAPSAISYRWNSTGKSESPDDFAYFSGKIKEFASDGISVNGKHYSVDSSQIYMYGFSNGSFFASQFIMKYPNLITAAALWAGGL